MPAYLPIESERLYEGIVAQIEQHILRGELKPGDRLPPERELAEQFRVSRTAVREAMKVLREKGLAESQAGRGTFITNVTSRAVRDSLGLMMGIERGDGGQNIVEIRAILEPEIAALAASRRTEAHLAAMRDSLGVTETAGDEPETYIRADLDFHRAIAEATQNDLILLLIDSVMDLLHKQRLHVHSVSGRAAHGRLHHRRIFEAIECGDVEGAKAAMLDHMRQVREDSAGGRANPGPQSEKRVE